MVRSRAEADAERQRDRADALTHARKLLELLHAHGIRVARLPDPRPSEAPRVYVNRESIAVSRGGDLNSTDVRRVETVLFRRELAPFRAALQAYREYATRWLDERAASFDEEPPRGNPFRRLGDDRVTLHDYELTGIQDAGNVCDADSFDFDAGGTADEIVSRLVDTDEFKDQWLEQNRGDVLANGLDPDEAYRWWLSGWRHVARRVVARELEERQQQARRELEDNPRRGRRDRGRGPLVDLWHVRRARRPEETVCGAPPTPYDEPYDDVIALVKREGLSSGHLNSVCSSCKRSAL